MTNSYRSGAVPNGRFLLCLTFSFRHRTKVKLSSWKLNVVSGVGLIIFCILLICGALCSNLTLFFSPPSLYVPEVISHVKQMVPNVKQMSSPQQFFPRSITCPWWSTEKNSSIFIHFRSSSTHSTIFRPWRLVRRIFFGKFRFFPKTAKTAQNVVHDREMENLVLS